jgi:putative SOS response-associated peptidase YedK
MCGRFVITSPPAAIRAAFDYGEQPNFPARHNIAPTQPVGVVLVEQGIRHFRLMRWGFLPGWVKDPRTFTLVINARAETVREKPAFRNAIRRRRCLIPADGYYEWHTAGDQKHPYFIYPRDGGPIGFAGIAETWCGPNGEEVDTVAIVTAAATDRLAMLHHRVPVTIAPTDFARWLDCASVNVNDVVPLMRAPADGEFAWHRVSRDVNRIVNDDECLIRPLSEQQLADETAAPRGKLVRRKSSVPDDGQGSLF